MINRIIDYCGKNLLIVFIFTIFFTVGSIVAIKNVPLDAIPDLSDVQVIIFTEWQGRNPKLVEDQITYPIVSKLLSAPKVKVVRGQSFFGFSFIYVIFEDGTDIYWARSRVLEYLNGLKGKLPESVNPVLGPDATGVGWVYQYVLLDEKNKYDLAQLRTFNDWYLRYWIASVPGVAEVASVGGYEKQYQVEVDPNKLRAYRISIKKIVEAIKASNNDIGARSLELAGHESLVNVSGYIKKVEDLENVVLGTKPNGVPIRVSDVAYVHLGPNMRRGVAEYNGKGEVVGGVVVMRHGENALKVIENVKEKIKDIEKSLPKGVKIVPVYDRSDLILKSIDTLKRTLIEESIVVALVIILFLFHLPSSFVVIITLPIAVMMAFIPMYFMGLTSNIMSLGGIAIAIGAMVDSAIVMVENAHKHLERWEESGRKEPRIQVILNGAKEVGEPLFFALLIITVSFTPIFALEAQEGRLFKPLAYTKTFSMFFAAILSITLIPALMGIFIRGKIQPETHNPINRFLIKVYDPIIRFVLKAPYQIIIISFITFLLSLTVIPKLGSEFMPPLNEGSILYMPTSLPGIGISESSRLLQIQDKLIKKIPEVLSVFGKAGRAETATDPAPLDMFETVVNLKPKEKWRPGITWDKIIEELDKLLKLPGTTNAWTMPIKARLDMLTTGVRTPIGIKIFGSDLKVIEKIGEHIEMLLKEVKGTRSIYAERAGSGYYLNINIDREKIARHGLTIEDVEMVISSALGGEEITTTIEGKERYTVNVRYLRELRDSPEKIRNIYIETPMGYQIPLSEVAYVKPESGPMQIRDEDASLVGFVYIDISDRDIGGYVDEAKKVLNEKLNLPVGYGIEWTGQYEFLQRIEKRLALIIPLTIFIIFFLHYMAFNSTVKSLMVMLSVPFALIGSLWFLLLYKFHFSVAVGVGLIALAGVAIETAIVMVIFLDEAYERHLKGGKIQTLKDLEDAVHEGAVQRVRPKLMTVCVGIAGLLPIMWNHGTGADVMQRIAAPMIGGLITSTILVLVIVPAIYFLWRKRELKG